MFERKNIAFIILGLGLLVTLVCTAVRIPSLARVFTSIDTGICGALLLTSLFIGALWSRNGIGDLKMLVLASAAVSVGLAIFALIFSISGSDTATLVAIWAGCFALFRILQANEMWTRPAALATVVMMFFWLGMNNSTLAQLRTWSAEWGTWVGSGLLDSVSVAHLREGTTIKVIEGELSVTGLAGSWFGVLPVVGLVTLLTILWRSSLFQALLMGFVALCTWSCMQGTYVWWSVSGASANAQPELLQYGIMGLLWNVLMLAVIFGNVLMIYAFTREIALEREDIDSPVATYFWNFFARFPASLTSQAIILGD